MHKVGEVVEEVVGEVRLVGEGVVQGGMLSDFDQIWLLLYSLPMILVG